MDRFVLPRLRGRGIQGHGYTDLNRKSDSDAPVFRAYLTITTSVSNRNMKGSDSKEVRECCLQSFDTGSSTYGQKHVFQNNLVSVPSTDLLTT